MTSLNSLVYELLSLRRGDITDTDPIDRRLVIDWIQTQRARLLHQKFDKPFTYIDEHLVQDLGTIQMETVDSNSLSVDLKDKMRRTAIDIPETIERKGGIGTFTRIGPDEKTSTKFNVVTYDRALVSGNGKFNKDVTYAFTLGDRVYITSKSDSEFALQYINIRGVFQDPIIAARIADPTWTYDDDYPINKSMIDQLKVLVLKEKFAVTLIQPSDRTDDLDDNPQGNATVQKGK